MSQDIRNICTIAHVDHGKTTLVDFLLRQSGTFQAHEQVDERIMDTQTLERERGITISAKNAAFFLGETKINIVDTPGHADFGGEVERIMGMVDGAILLVDAAEGPLPQTRFVLEKAINKGLQIILCINKVDRPEVANGDYINECVNKTFDLFVELGATEKQCSFPIVYACAREGWCTLNLHDIPAYLSKEKTGDLKPLFHEILQLPPPKIEDSPFLKLLVSDVMYSEYVGPMALGKFTSGKVSRGQEIFRHGIRKNGAAWIDRFIISRLYCFEGMRQKEVDELKAGEIGLIAGSEAVDIGDTLVGSPDIAALTRIAVEPPTLRMIFSINTTPNSGKEGVAIQSRQLRQRLEKEVKSNPALKLEETNQPDQFFLLGRGELQFGIIIETMRREGLEFMVGRPNILFQRDNEGKLLEPFEKITLDLPQIYSGDVTSLFQQRKGVLTSYDSIASSGGEPRIRITIEIPTRGLLGTHSQYLTATRGTGLISAEMLGYKPYLGDISHRQSGSLISDRSGFTTAYALFNIQQRGILFLGDNIWLYEGMIIGEHAKENDLNVNACKPKKLTNIRTQGSEGITILQGTKKMSLEECIEWIDDDEWIEITPKNIRLRKKVLSCSLRSVRRADRISPACLE